MLVGDFVNRLSNWDGPSSANRELVMKLLGKVVSFVLAKCRRLHWDVKVILEKGWISMYTIPLSSSRCLAQYCAIVPVWYVICFQIWNFFWKFENLKRVETWKNKSNKDIKARSVTWIYRFPTVTPKRVMTNTAVLVIQHGCARNVRCTQAPVSRALFRWFASYLIGR